MAEFSMVMKQAARLCSAQKQCAGCPLDAVDHALCELRKNVMRKFSEHEARRVDNIVMDWAAKNPEPRYPSWNEAWKQLMPNAHNKKSPCPCFFLDTDRAMKLCSEQECIACKNTTIPADIAEKLGIKPIEEVER